MVIAVEETQISMIRAACDSYPWSPAIWLSREEKCGRKLRNLPRQSEDSSILMEGCLIYYAMVMLFLYMIEVKFICDSKSRGCAVRSRLRLGLPALIGVGFLGILGYGVLKLDCRCCQPKIGTDNLRHTMRCIYGG